MTLGNAEVFQERLEGTLDVYTNQLVFAPGEPIFVHGQAMPKEPIIIRLFTPDDTIAEFEQLMTNEDGSFHHFLTEWDEPTTNLPYGTYILEVISNQQGGISKRIEVKFSNTSEFIQVPIERNVSTIVFAPETAAVSRDFRVFVQTSSDGLLIGNDPNQILGTSHVHLPNGQVENLEDDLKTLHQGLYYVDYLPALEGIYVFHMVTFDEGNISHGSGATNVLSQDIRGISTQILELNQILDETKTELANLKQETSTFGSSLSDASSNLDESVILISDSVGNIEEGSSQLNALLFPVVASIAIILALQIVIIARRR
tara:strand:+ start:109 stop:1053 length:945 start_codon:yes stop_codon:yes gene_type:complete